MVDFTTGERAPSVPWIGGFVGPRASLDAIGKRKNTCPSWESNSNHPTHSLVIIQIELPAPST